MGEIATQFHLPGQGNGRVELRIPPICMEAVGPTSRNQLSLFEETTAGGQQVLNRR